MHTGRGTEDQYGAINILYGAINLKQPCSLGSNCLCTNHRVNHTKPKFRNP